MIQTQSNLTLIVLIVKTIVSAVLDTFSMLEALKSPF